MKKNIIKEKIKSGQAVYGTFVRYPDPGLAEVLGYQGWDFLTFDAEHGTLEPRDCENVCRAAELTGVTPMVRVTTNQKHILLRYLDAGAQGVQVPWVSTAQQAEAVVDSVKYYPDGTRGLASVRASEYAQTKPLGEYIVDANRETLIAVQAETSEALENIEQIVQVKGLDIIFIGPMDLSHSLGLAGQLTNPKVVEAIERIISVVSQSDKAVGIFAGKVDAAKKWRDRGARYIITTVESVLCPACKNYLKAVRE